MTSPRLLVIQHEDDCPPAWFGEWFVASGLGYDVLPAHRGRPVPTDLDGYVGLAVLGGEMGANDDARFPWLTPTKALIASVVAAGQPFLGICLGHQLAAAALGGEVVPNPHGHATGLTPVRLTPEGAADVLLSSVNDGDRSIQWNNDVVSRLPANAVELATGPDGTVQAARFGPRAWGVQFHPEASPAVFDSWTIAKPSAAIPREDGIDVGATAREIAAASAELRVAWEPLATRFAAVALERSPVS